MKKIFVLAAMLLVFAACGENKDNPDTPAPSQASLTGIWELSSVTTKAAVGSTSVSIYVEFASGGSFSLYQKIGDGRYSHFTDISYCTGHRLR